MINLKKSSLRCIIEKLKNIKHRWENLTSSQSENTSYLKRKTIKLTADISTATLETRKKNWNDIVNMLGGNNHQVRILNSPHGLTKRPKLYFSY